MSDDSPAPDADALLQRARLAEERLGEILAAYRTLKNENEGYRDRINRNLERRYDQRRERLLLRFIEILDNLDRALEAAERSYLGDAVVEGLIMVRTQLLQTLQEEGLERIPVLGRPYDPAVSEAVGTEPVSDPEHHHVVMKDLLRGYRLNGRVARASKVVVGEYREGEVAEAGPAGVEAETGETGAAPDAQAAQTDSDRPHDAAPPPAAAEAPDREQGAAATEPPPTPPQKNGKPRREITFSSLSLDLDAAIHEAAESATELEDDDTLAEIVADDEVTDGPPQRDAEDGKKGSE